MTASPNKWWHSCSAILRFMPGEDGFTLDDIIASLPSIASSGFQAIHITAPYSSAGFFPWWGLMPMDYFAPNAALRCTMSDFSTLSAQCHRHGLRLIYFLNIGYADVRSPLWHKACYDHRNRIDSFESRLFRWDNRPLKPADSHFLQGGHWHWSDMAQSNYWCNWIRDELAEPQYDWSSPDTHAFAEAILEHWLNTGADGIIVDAVNWYLDADMDIIRHCVTDVVHRHPQVMCIPEGGTGFGDSFEPWLQSAKFDVLDDQTFHSDLHWNGSAIMNAMCSSDGDQIDRALRVCQSARAQGAVCWSYLSWGDAWTPEKRLMEIALLIATGHMTEILPAYLKTLQPHQETILSTLLKSTRLPALAPINRRTRVIPLQGNACYACLCVDDKQPVLCVFNLSDRHETFHLPTDRHAAWTDVIHRRRISPHDGILPVFLAPRSFAFLTPEN